MKKTRLCLLLTALCFILTLTLTGAGADAYPKTMPEIYAYAGFAPKYHHITFGMHPTEVKAILQEPAFTGGTMGEDYYLAYYVSLFIEDQPELAVFSYRFNQNDDLYLALIDVEAPATRVDQFVNALCGSGVGQKVIPKQISNGNFTLDFPAASYSYYAHLIVNGGSPYCTINLFLAQDAGFKASFFSNWIDTESGGLPEIDPFVPFVPYTVRVTSPSLNIRKGAGNNTQVTGVIKDKGIYTIVEEKDGPGASKWGKLKSGAGWISLDFTVKYDIPAGSTPKPTAETNITDSGTTWNGPVGKHPTADWDCALFGNGIGVRNPNPADRLHLRTAPKSSASSLGKYYNGVRVDILGPEDNGWVPVSVGVLRGYMNAAFLTEDPLASAAVKSAMPVMKVNAPSGSVNLRKGQSTSSASLGTLKNGTEVVLMGFTNTWAHVIVNGKMGFIMGIYLK